VALAVPVVNPVPKIVMILPGAKLPAASDAALTTRRFCAADTEAHSKTKLMILVLIRETFPLCRLAHAGPMGA